MLGVSTLSSLALMALRENGRFRSLDLLALLTTHSLPTRRAFHTRRHRLHAALGP